MTTRRVILKSIPLVAAVSVAPAMAKSEEEEAQEHAECLAQLMQKRFGGTWQISFDQLGEFVLVSKRRV